MILSDHQCRWAEVRLYEICMDIYKISNKSIDVIDFIEYVCSLGNITSSKMRIIVSKMLSDPYYAGDRKELFLLGNMYGVPMSKLAKQAGTSRQAVYQMLARYKETYTPRPHLLPEEDKEILKFLEIYKRLTASCYLEDYDGHDTN